MYLCVFGWCCRGWGVVVMRRGMGNYALLHCIGVWRKSPIEALSPSFSPLFLSLTLSSLLQPSITSTFIFHFLAISPCYFVPCIPPSSFPLSIRAIFLAIFLHCSLLPSLLLSGVWGKQGQEAAWLSDNGTHQNQKAAPTSPTSHTHRHTNITRQTGHSSCRLHRIPRLG